jgi:hypothetical protein
MTDWEITEKFEYQRYDREITKSYYVFSDDETWTLDETTICTYNEYGNMTSSKTVFPDNDYYRLTVIEYEDMPGNLNLALDYPHENIIEISLDK